MGDTFSIKPLEWVKMPLGIRANTMIGQYNLSTGHYRPRLWLPGCEAHNYESHPTIESAKKSAQSHFESKILAGLIPIEKSKENEMTSEQPEEVRSDNLYNPPPPREMASAMGWIPPEELAELKRKAALLDKFYPGLTGQAKCPFCNQIADIDGGGDYWQWLCLNKQCHAIGPKHDTPDAALESAESIPEALTRLGLLLGGIRKIHGTVSMWMLGDGGVEVSVKNEDGDAVSMDSAVTLHAAIEKALEGWEKDNG
jgi:hypothetical protein